MWMEKYRLRHYFNSQPHEEADGVGSDGGQYSTISTHSLTRRLTTITTTVMTLYYISTHSLTRRLTVRFPVQLKLLTYFNSQPHEEADSNFKQKSFYLKLFFIFIA